MKHKTRLLALVFSLLVSSHITAQTIAITNPWVRATVQGQKATGAFMTITSKENSKLVAVSSPAAGVVEIHEMKMEKDVMKMAAVPFLNLPAGQPVELKPGGYHVMLMDLKQALPKDSMVPVTLQFQDAKGNKSQLELKVPVLLQAPGTPAGGGMPASHMHGNHKH